MLIIIFESENPLTITTLSGKKIHGSVQFNQTAQVNLAAQPKGVYLCVVKNANHVQTVKIELK